MGEFAVSRWICHVVPALTVAIACALGCQVVSPPHLRGPRSDENKPIDFDNDPLSMAAACIERGDEAEAAVHMLTHVRSHPDQVMFRMQLGEILLRLKRHGEAQQQFEEFISLAQDGSPAVQKQVLHAHTRLMEIGREREDEYVEHLNRGIGLFIVAEGLIANEAEPAEFQRMLIRSANELREAQTLRPDQARPAWYLHRAWLALDQSRPAEKSLRKAKSASAFSFLTPRESRELASSVGS
jgi:tetratricopeptide (TPR) repeat protein